MGEARLLMAEKESVRAEIQEVCRRCARVLGIYPADRPAYFKLPPSECPHCREEEAQ
jgi:hypothetical protein